MRWLAGMFLAIAASSAHAEPYFDSVLPHAPIVNPRTITPAFWHHSSGAPLIATLVPGSGSCPSVNAVQQGSGSVEMPVADFDEPPNVWVNQGDTTHAITVGAATSNRGWIKAVTFCMAGNSTSPITAQIINPRTGDVGWTVIPISTGGTDGDYTLDAYVTPVNGFERLITIPLTLNNNGALTRAQRFVDAVAGSDSNDGLTLGTAWATLLHAELTAPSGAQVYSCGSETYLEDSNTGTFNNNARMIDFLINPACVGSGFYTVSRTSRTSPSQVWNPRANKLRFDHVHVDMSKIVQIQGGGSAAITWFSNADLTDPNGPTGPQYGYTNVTNGGGQAEIAQTPFGSTATAVYITDSTLSTVVTAGLQLERNVTATVSWDLVAWATPQNNNNAAIFNVQGIKQGDFKTRLSLEQPPTGPVVASAVFSTPNTTITYNAGTSLATLAAASGSILQVVGGPLDGQQFTVVTQTPDPTTPHTIVTGDASAIGVGNEAYIFVVAHADANQFLQLTSTSTPLTNIYEQRYKATGNGSSLQALLTQPTPPLTNTGTINTVGTAITFSTSQTLKQYDCIQVGGGAQQYQSQPLAADVSGTTGTLLNAFTVDQSGVAWHQGKTVKDFALVASITDGPNNELAQPQGCEINNIEIQDTLADQTYQFRNATNGFGLMDDAFFDSLLNGSTAGAGSMTSDAAPGFPAIGLTIDNNQFGVGTARGTNGATNLATFASTGFAAPYKPTGGSVTKALLGTVGNPNYPDGTPLFPYAYDLTPLTSASVVGAQQP